MKVAVVGASGFVGRHVLAQLRLRGLQTIATATRPPTLQDDSVRWTALDLHRPPADPWAALDHAEVVIHLAWAGLPNYGSAHHVDHELPAQRAFLTSLVEAGLPSLVVTGTCFEYGFQYGPLAPDAPARPANPYAIAKDTLRLHLQSLQARHPFNLSWARLFYMYGQGQPANSLYPALKRAVEEGKPVFPMSMGEQLRDYLPVESVAQRLVELAATPRNRGVLNICSGEPISVRRLVETWVRDHGWRIELGLGQFPYAAHEPLAFWGVPPAPES
ncbi:NAD-dependent epimerase/dehydratase family protein [Ramlibacter sp.]|uniref:NAD-dependent epimerase/dehydratase family protein n=1 Tax=Ramlibacter sp. TaxID=1917967 RepID=UPI003D0C5444